MKNMNEKSLLILASASPRRKYLLEQAGLSFDIIPSSVDEDSIPVTAPENYVQVLAEAKALDIAEKYPECWVIGADTIVMINGTILGKPGSRDDARAMLEQLSGQSHFVYTGYSIHCREKKIIISEAVKTEVVFKELSHEEIEWYVHTKEPFDKAGAYAIQGLGTFLVRRIAGSYTNVVGLPVCEVIEHLIKEGVITIGSHTNSANMNS